MDTSGLRLEHRYDVELVAVTKRYGGTVAVDGSVEVGQ